MVQCIGITSSGGQSSLPAGVYCHHHVGQGAGVPHPPPPQSLFSSLMGFFALHFTLQTLQAILSLFGVTIVSVIVYAFATTASYTYREGNIEYKLDLLFTSEIINRPMCNFGVDFAEFQSELYDFQSRSSDYHYLVYGASGSGK